MDHEAFGVADVGEVREKFEAVDKRATRFFSAAKTECQNGAGSTGHVLARKRLIRAGREARVLHPGDTRVLRQPLRDGECVLTMLLHAEPQRFNALNKQKCVKGAEARSEIAQAVDA